MSPLCVVHMPLCLLVSVKWTLVLRYSGGWNLQSYHSLPLGSNPVQPIRCCLAKGIRLWVGYWNKVHVIDVDSRKVEVKKKKIKQKKRVIMCVVFRLAMKPTVFTLTANLLGVGAQREAGPFLVRWWKWRLDIVSIRPDPQAV